MMASVATVQQRIDQILKFMAAKLKFVNCHMVNYLTDDHWTTFVPKAIREEINDGVCDKSADLIQRFLRSGNGYDADLGDYPETKAFVEETRRHTLAGMREVCLGLSEFQRELKKFGCEMSSEPPLKIKEFMSAKKNHEVEITASLVNDLCRHLEQQKSSIEKSIIIDAGDGKGYLSSMLALQYGKFVLGIDASETNTHGAEKRKQKMSRAWKALVKKAKIEKNVQKSDGLIDEAITEGNYCPVTQFIDERTDFVRLAHENFQETFDTFCLTGLHTCGNLAPNSLKIYQKNDKITALCNIGCCYHLLVEEFGQDLFYNEPKYELNKNSLGFPLSTYLKEKRIFLGRNARMHASQSIYRFFAEKDLPHRTLHYRAMLQVLLQDILTPDQRSKCLVGKSKAGTFEEYVNSAFDKFDKLPQDHDVRPDKDTIATVEAKYDHFLIQLQLFYILRLFLAPVTESLIILDRLLFLKEHGLDKSFVVELFDNVVSPRCYGIISLK